MARLPAAAADRRRRCRASRAPTRASSAARRSARRAARRARPWRRRARPRRGARAALGLPADAFVVAVLGRISAGRARTCSSARSPSRRCATRAASLALPATRWPRRGAPRRARCASSRPRSASRDRVRLVGFRDDVEQRLRRRRRRRRSLHAARSAAQLRARGRGRGLLRRGRGATAGCRRSSATARPACCVAPGDPAALAAGAGRAAPPTPSAGRALGAAAAGRRARRASRPTRLLERTQALYDETLGVGVRRPLRSGSDPDLKRRRSTPPPPRPPGRRRPAPGRRRSGPGPRP